MFLTVRPTATHSPNCRPEESAGAARGGANAYGAFSVETFANAGGLTYTHEDAQGFYDYVKQFAAPNFWYRDGGVAVWAYYETYDDWQDTYGMDAVNVVYHSGHGGRLADGRVWFPLGADWSGQGTNAWSDQMRLGNERVNYIFWSTCFACPVYAPLNPITTWNSANLGFRMLFGYETTSVDDPNYGKYFFQEWNKNKSFSTAWLDASWRISHGQVPSVVACGANQADADARLSSERLFNWAHVPKNWWSWRWYNASRSAPPNMTARERNISVPQDMSSAVLRPIDVNERVLRSAVDRFGLRLTIPREVGISPSGASQISDGDTTLAFGADGSVEAHLAQHNYDNRDQISLTDAAAIAQEALGLYGQARENQLCSTWSATKPRPAAAPRVTANCWTRRLRERRSSSVSSSTGCRWSHREPARCVSRWTTTARSPMWPTPPVSSTG